MESPREHEQFIETERELKQRAYASERYSQFPDLDAKRLELGDEEFVWWCIAGSYTPGGCERWWNRPRKHLDEKTPSEVWNEMPEQVIGLARLALGYTAGSA